MPRFRGGVSLMSNRDLNAELIRGLLIKHDLEGPRLQMCLWTDIKQAYQKQSMLFKYCSISAMFFFERSPIFKGLSAL